ncbi:MAG: malonyl-CoA decarboxylase family protein [Pseudomonadota bacterium]
MSSFSLFQELLPAIFEKKLGFSSFFKANKSRYEDLDIFELCEQIVAFNGDSANLLLAEQIMDKYQLLDKVGKLEFFECLLNNYDLDIAEIQTAINAYEQEQNYENFHSFVSYSEPKRQELLRRLNLASSGTRKLVKMREDLFSFIQLRAEFKKVDFDFQHLFRSWFNRGFLVMRPIDWNTPAHILEKVISYESVHEIGSWDELRSRLEPEDRKCFAFFHPSMLDDPLIFVEVALTHEISSSIEEVLNHNREIVPKDTANTAIFYSISNCHRGLKGVSFGTFLIKQVAQHLKQDCENLQYFCTLSPILGFTKWLKEQGQSDYIQVFQEKFEQHEVDSLKEQTLTLLAKYFLEAKNHSGEPYDPVARFHLGNGAKLSRLNWCANMSPKGIVQSLGLMVNYLYDLDKVEANHEAYTVNKEIIVDSNIKQLLKNKKKDSIDE